MFFYYFFFFFFFFQVKIQKNKIFFYLLNFLNWILQSCFVVFGTFDKLLLMVQGNIIYKVSTCFNKSNDINN